MSWLQPSLLAVSKNKHLNDQGCFGLESPCDSGWLFPTSRYLTLLPDFYCVLLLVCPTQFTQIDVTDLLSTNFTHPFTPADLPRNNIPFI